MKCSVQSLVVGIMLFASLQANAADRKDVREICEARLMRPEWESGKTSRFIPKPTDAFGEWPDWYIASIENFFFEVQEFSTGLSAVIAHDRGTEKESYDRGILPRSSPGVFTFGFEEGGFTASIHCN